MKAKANVTYDREADAIYVHLSDGKYARGADLDDHRRVDYDARGNPIGVELLFVSHGVELDGLPFADDLAASLAKLEIKLFA